VTLRAPSVVAVVFFGLVGAAAVGACSSPPGGDGSSSAALSPAAEDLAADAGAELCPVVDPPAKQVPIVDSWTSKAPANDGSPRTTLASVVDPECTFTLLYVTHAHPGFPSTYDLYLEKASTTAGSCAEDKGWMALATSDNFVPTGGLARHPTEKLLALVVTYHTTPSGEDPGYTSLWQLDWKTGFPLHVSYPPGVIQVKDAAPPEPALPLKATGIRVSDCRVVVSGDGQVATPVDAGSGSMFTATYLHFLADGEQAPTSADSADNDAK
jgi:hypothetical protein